MRSAICPATTSARAVPRSARGGQASRRGRRRRVAAAAESRGRSRRMRPTARRSSLWIVLNAWAQCRYSLYTAMWPTTSATRWRRAPSAQGSGSGPVLAGRARGPQSCRRSPTANSYDALSCSLELAGTSCFIGSLSSIGAPRPSEPHAAAAAQVFIHSEPLLPRPSPLRAALTPHYAASTNPLPFHCSYDASEL